MNLSRVITGLISLGIGIFIIYRYYSRETLITGILLIIFGLALILNKKEDIIESIKK